MNITVYCGSNFGDNPHFEEAAHDLGAWIARAGHTLVYGGSSVGLMGAVSRAAIEGGAPVIGVEPEFFIEAGVAQHDLTELIVVETMGERKSKMIELGDAFVALPGGVGTLEEISEIFTRVRLAVDGRTPVFRPVRPRPLPLPALGGGAGAPFGHRRHAPHRPLRRPPAAESRVEAC